MQPDWTDNTVLLHLSKLEMNLNKILKPAGINDRRQKPNKKGLLLHRCCKDIVTNKFEHMGNRTADVGNLKKK